MQDCQAMLNDSLQEFSHSFLVGSALEKGGSAKPPQTLQKQLQTEQGSLGAGWELFAFLVD